MVCGGVYLFIYVFNILEVMFIGSHTFSLNSVYVELVRKKTLIVLLTNLQASA